MSDVGLFAVGTVVTLIVLGVTMLLLFGFQQDAEDRADKRRRGTTQDLDVRP